MKKTIKFDYSFLRYFKKNGEHFNKKLIKKQNPEIGNK